eukprot:4247152-Pyramimonas_sp.AAC.3
MCSHWDLGEGPLERPEQAWAQGLSVVRPRTLGHTRSRFSSRSIINQGAAIGRPPLPTGYRRFRL